VARESARANSALRELALGVHERRRGGDPRAVAAAAAAVAAAAAELAAAGESALEFAAALDLAPLLSLGAVSDSEQPTDNIVNASNKGERGTTAKQSGTDNPFKKMTPHPTDPSKVRFKDPHTGKTIDKPKPPGFDDYWKTRR